MKAAFLTLGGAFLGVLLAVAAFWLHGLLFGAAAPLNEERSNFIALAFVFGVLPAGATAGAAAGYLLHRRQRRGRSTR